MTETQNQQNQPDDHDVISQIRIATANPLPLTIGALLGALVPVGTFTLWHEEIATWQDVRTLFFLGGLMFSAITVFRWGQRAYGSTSKAFFFVLLAEGLMSFSTTTWLSVGALGYLVCINAVANGCNLAVAHAARRARDLDRDQARTAESALEALRSFAGSRGVSAERLDAILAEIRDRATQAAVTPVAELALVPPTQADAPVALESPPSARPARATRARARKPTEPKARVTRAPAQSTGDLN